MRLLWISLAGGAGCGARYLVAGWVNRLIGAPTPWGTLTVNLLGSFLLAFLFQVMVALPGLSHTWRLALTAGFLGGFTTYSTFNFETLMAIESGHWWTAGGNILATLLGCLVAGALGLLAGRALVGG